MTITNNALTSFEYDIWLHGWPHVNTSLINKNLFTIAWMTCHYSNPSTFISDDMEWMRWQITSRVCYNFWHANYFFVSFLFKTNFAHLFHYSKAPFYAISRWLFKLQTILYIYIDVMKINLVFLSFYNFSGWMRRSYIFLLCCRLKLVRTIKMKSSPTV